MPRSLAEAIQTGAKSAAVKGDPLEINSFNNANLFGRKTGYKRILDMFGFIVSLSAKAVA